MSKSFPLYDQMKSIPSKGTRDWGKLSSQINSIDSRSHLEVIYAFIYHHSLKDPNCRALLRSIPYNGKLVTKDRGLRFEVDRLPLPLQEIIANYIDSVTR